MSVVACRILPKGGYEIAADSITVQGYTQSKGDRSYHSKLISVNGMILGATGLAEEAALLFLFASNHKPAEESAGSVITFLSEFIDWKRKQINKAELENSYLIGLETKVFRSNGWFVEEVKAFEAIGAGADYALAALHLGHNVKQSVEVAAELSIYCEKPVVYMSRQKTRSVRVRK